MLAIQGGFVSPKTAMLPYRKVKHTGLGKYLSRPGVSTSPTPNVGSTVNLLDQIDLSTSITNAASALGLVSPSVQNQQKSQVRISGSGKVSGGKVGNGSTNLFLIGIFGIVGVVAFASMRA
jgi:hypothetical protein